MNARYNLSSWEFGQHAHCFFAQMRRETPVCKARLNRWQEAYLITRYEDVLAAFKDPRLAKDPNHARNAKGRSSMPWMPSSFRPLLHNMLNMDDPDHRRLRNLVHKAFTPRMIANLAPRIEAIAHQLLDEAAKKSEVELVQDFALPLPVTVIAEMIGVPPEDRARFRRWSAAIVVDPTPWNMIRAVPAVRNFLRYMRGLVEERRRVPQDDLLTALVQANEAGDHFTEDELLGMVFLLLTAGHETTVSLIANGTYTLLRHPEQLAQLRQEPELMENAVEELLRYESPLQTSEISFAREPMCLHGVEIPQGAMVLPAILSANRDESAFPDAERLDLARSPNKHLAFGQGIHYCLGAPLARLEGQIAFRVLLERAPTLRLAVPPSQVEFQSLMILRRVTTLPVLF